jgi:hypothetical protein
VLVTKPDEQAVLGGPPPAADDAVADPIEDTTEIPIIFT